MWKICRLKLKDSEESENNGKRKTVVHVGCLLLGAESGYFSPQLKANLLILCCLPYFHGSIKKNYDYDCGDSFDQRT